jgi:hypothetical protein
MSHPSLITQQAVRYLYVTPVTHTVGSASPRYVYVTPVTHTAGSALRICHTRHSHGRQCDTYMSHPSLTRQAVRHNKTYGVHLQLSLWHKNTRTLRCVKHSLVPA